MRIQVYKISAITLTLSTQSLFLWLRPRMIVKEEIIQWM